MSSSLQDPTQREPAAGAVSELVERLTATLGEADRLLRSVEAGSARDPAADEDLAARAEGLERRLAAAEADGRELGARLVDAEQRVRRMTALYVATFHLHAHQEPAAVQQAIAEIAAELVGAERFVLLLRERPEKGEAGPLHRVVLHRPANVEPGELDPLFAGGHYRGGDPMIDATLADGVLREAGSGGVGPTRALAAVPLNVTGRTVGGLVLLRLFAHKAVLDDDDRDLLELLAAHAASAMLVAELFRVKDRRMRSIESLVRLARGEG